MIVHRCGRESGPDWVRRNSWLTLGRASWKKNTGR